MAVLPRASYPLAMSSTASISQSQWIITICFGITMAILGIITLWHSCHQSRGSIQYGNAASLARPSRGSSMATNASHTVEDPDLEAGLHRSDTQLRTMCSPSTRSSTLVGHEHGPSKHGDAGIPGDASHTRTSGPGPSTSTTPHHISAQPSITESTAAHVDTPDQQILVAVPTNHSAHRAVASDDNDNNPAHSEALVSAKPGSRDFVNADNAVKNGTSV